MAEIPAHFYSGELTIEGLEKTRESYIRSLDYANRDKLLYYKGYFESKLEEAQEWNLFAESRGEYVLRERIFIPAAERRRLLDTKENTTKLILLWKGLLEETKRRLGEA